jgi:hypothetical protein
MMVFRQGAGLNPVPTAHGAAANRRQPFAFPDFSVISGRFAGPDPQIRNLRIG